MRFYFPDGGVRESPLRAAPRFRRFSPVFLFLLFSTLYAGAGLRGVG